MKFKWNKGLLFPSLMLLSTASISIQAIQSENNNQLLLVENNTDKKNSIKSSGYEQKKFPVDSISFQPQLTENLSSNENSLLLTLTVLSLFVLLLTQAYIQKKSSTSFLTSFLTLNHQHVHYLKFWTFQRHITIKAVAFLKLNTLLFSQFKHINSARFNVSQLHQVTSN